MKQPSSIPAFPLQWPMPVPRSKVRGTPAFKARNWTESLALLRAELRRLGAQSIVISTNQQLRQDGEPYAQVRKIDDPGVAVYFRLDGDQLCFPCDRWSSIAHNLRAITLHIEAMRAQQRYGVGTAKQAFTGYKALTATAGESEPWWTVLGIPEDSNVDQVKAAHRSAAALAHPDRGGSADQMARINTARDRALAEIAGRA